MFSSHCLSGIISAVYVLDMERSMFKAVKTRFLVGSHTSARRCLSEIVSAGFVLDSSNITLL